MSENYKALQAENYQLREYIISLQSRLIDSQNEVPELPPNIDLSQPRPDPTAASGTTPGVAPAAPGTAPAVPVTAPGAAGAVPVTAAGAAPVATPVTSAPVTTPAASTATAQGQPSATPSSTSGEDLNRIAVAGLGMRKHPNDESQYVGNNVQAKRMRSDGGESDSKADVPNGLPVVTWAVWSMCLILDPVSVPSMSMLCDALGPIPCICSRDVCITCSRVSCYCNFPFPLSVLSTVPVCGAIAMTWRLCFSLGRFGVGLYSTRFCVFFLVLLERTRDSSSVGARRRRYKREDKISITSRHATPWALSSGSVTVTFSLQEWLIWSDPVGSGAVRFALLCESKTRVYVPRYVAMCVSTVQCECDCTGSGGATAAGTVPLSIHLSSSCSSF